MIHTIDAERRALPAELFRGSTHLIGLAEAIELGRALDQLPARLLVVGIEGASFTAGAAADPPGRASGGGRRAAGATAPAPVRPEQ